MQNPLDMQGRLVIVTGGARGVGAGITRSFLEAGADVVVIGRSAPETPVSSGAREAGFQAADVRDPEQVSAAFAAIHASSSAAMRPPVGATSARLTRLR